MQAKWKKLLLVAGILLLSRLVLFNVGLIFGSGFSLSDWTRFDGLWYNNIMTTGYDNTMPQENPNDIVCQSGTGYCQRDVAFFPLYPTVTKLTADVFHLDTRLAGLIISNLCFVIAGVLLFRLVTKLKFEEKVAWWSVAVLAVFPFGYVFSAVMTESMFMMLLILAYSLALEKKYLFAGLVGLLLSATRNTGLLFALPLLLVFIEQQKVSGFKDLLTKVWAEKKILMAIILVPMGLIAFMLFLNAQVGDALAFVKIQNFWEKPVLGLNPLFAFFFSLIDKRIESSWLIHIMNLSVVISMAALFVYSFKKKILKMSLNNILLWIIVPMTAGTLLAMGRYSAVAFPLYIIIGFILAKHKRIAIGFIGLFAILLIIMTKLYLSGAWITV